MKKIVIIVLSIWFLLNFGLVKVMAATEGNPSQLFDIALIIDQSKVVKISDLKARVTFINFGSEDIPVKMHFKIVNASGKEYYNSDESTVIQTEGVFNKSFDEIYLDDGKYTLVLTTLYNTNIKDEFKQEIEIDSSIEKVNSFWMKVWDIRYMVLGVLILLIAILPMIYLLRTKRKK